MMKTVTLCQLVAEGSTDLRDKLPEAPGEPRRELRIFPVGELRRGLTLLDAVGGASTLSKTRWLMPFGLRGALEALAVSYWSAGVGRREQHLSEARIIAYAIYSLDRQIDEQEGIRRALVAGDSTDPNPNLKRDLDVVVRRRRAYGSELKRWKSERDRLAKECSNEVAQGILAERFSINQAIVSVPAVFGLQSAYSSLSKMCHPGLATGFTHFLSPQPELSAKDFLLVALFTRHGFELAVAVLDYLFDGDEFDFSEVVSWQLRLKEAAEAVQTELGVE